MNNNKCPFCGKLKIKVDSKKSNSFRYTNGIREDLHTASVRCNCCHARGPTISIWLKSGTCNVKGLLEEKAIELWNSRI